MQSGVMQMRINISTATNSNYVKYLCVMLTSLFRNNEGDQFDVYILNADLSEKDRTLLDDLVKDTDNYLHYLYVDREKFDCFPTAGRITIESYFRLLMPELLENIERVLYLDVDLIVTGSIREFYDRDFKGNYAIACQDMLFPHWDANYQRIFHCIDERKYFNAGVMLWNLKLIREDYPYDSFIRIAEGVNYELPHHDQSILNYCFYGRVAFEEAHIWNYIPAAEFRNGKNTWDDIDARIIHFATKHPWDTCIKPSIVEKWWEYAKFCPNYVNLLEEQVDRLEKGKEEITYKEMQRVEIEAVLEAMLAEAENSVLSKRTARNIVVYGAGHLAEKMIELMEFIGIDDWVSAVVDKNRQDHFRGRKVYSDYRFVKPDEKYLLVVTPSYRQHELIEKIRCEIPDDVDVIPLLQFVRGDWD